MFCQNAIRPGTGRWLLPVPCAFCLFLVTAHALSTEAAAQLTERLKLTASDAAEGDFFGRPVAVSGNTAIVGADRKDNSRGGFGSAYLFDVTTGEELFQLRRSGLRRVVAFGASVAISGSIAVVGELGVGRQTGAAYLFDATTGEQLFELTASDAAEGDIFGVSVAISGTTTIVGALKNDNDGVDSGSAYLFDATTGEELLKLTASDASPGDTFGASVGISGNTAIVGAPRFDASGNGSAYLFDVTTGQQLFKLTGSDTSDQDFFGLSVAISDDLAIVGAPGNDILGSAAGAAYIFDVTTGEELFQFTASDGARNDFFGGSVAIDDGTAIVGARIAGRQAGAAYVFDVTSGEELLKLAASDASRGDMFGSSVGISGNAVFVGAIGDDHAGTYSGSAYLFDVPEPSSVVLGALGLVGFLTFAGWRRRL